MENVIDNEVKREDSFALDTKKALRLYRATCEGRAAETLSMIRYPKPGEELVFPD